MKMKALGVFAALGVVAGWVVACDTSQPVGGCPVTHLSNFVFFDPKPGQDMTKPCIDPAQNGLTGDFVSFSKYNKPKTTVNTIGVALESIARFQLDPRLDQDDFPVSTGNYDWQPAGGFCTASNLTPTRINVPQGEPKPNPDGGAPLPGDPAMDVTIEWSNLRVASTPEVPGTQWMADLKYTNGSCTAEYTAIGASPAVPCGVPGEQLDDSLCNPAALPDGGTAPACNPDTGECLNPDFVMACDPDTAICRPKSEVPSLR